MLREKVKISDKSLEEINAFLLDPNNKLVNDLLAVIEKYGGVDEINRKAEEAGKLENILGKLREKKSPYMKDLEWLTEKRDKNAFISIKDYRRKVLGDKADSMQFNDENPVTLEISACQYFPFLKTEARHAVEHGELMPGRFIRVRNMTEQVADDDILAVSAAVQIMAQVDVKHLRQTDQTAQTHTWVVQKLSRVILEVLVSRMITLSNGQMNTCTT